MVLWRTSLFQLVLGFFGLTPSYRAELFNQIHEILFYGKGGYDFETIYNMPLWLRRFTYNKIYEHYETKNTKSDNVNESIKNMKSVGATNKTPQQIHVPSYVTKASKK